jgi:hypothetical protein
LAINTYTHPTPITLAGTTVVGIITTSDTSACPLTTIALMDSNTGNPYIGSLVSIQTTNGWVYLTGSVGTQAGLYIRVTTTGMVLETS